MKKYVLDTSSIYAYIEADAGDITVKQILKESQKNVYISFATLTEIYYTCQAFNSNSPQKEIYDLFRTLPIQIIWSNEDIALSAGTIKGTYSLSFADAYIAATAEQLKAILVHRDPEFEPIKNVKQLILPYKNK